MELIQTQDYAEMSRVAAEILIKEIKTNPQAVLGLATGSTPAGTYEALIRDHEQHGTSYKQVHTVNLDEYIGLDQSDPNSYKSFMKAHLFNAIDLPETHAFLPNGEATDIQEECRRYDEKIRQLGGVDLQVLGIGQNGHIGFNEPGSSFSMTTHVVELTHNTRKANARFFKQLKDVPTHAITMGIKNILESRRVLLLASGSSKAEAMARLLNAEQPDEAFPASALYLHPHVTIIADKEALALVEDQKRRAF
ncbi:glucosamine-6-phosphate deaminase 1 [Pullulanibacillus camelliae]|uniref:Glucosamine-6-phosphate deaminase n=1 Tax=Pullulanibacillus camelliae TaxID=1707096 RepID=A0A8J3DZY4_9BACL|nr:glucosamine-6-phosphate deaminase [Pullulanibacillus camelliae]GGE52347.1 glucosamine-6-phosphate deaminase 1 [Pullulanibacillus camelliae]